MESIVGVPANNYGIRDRFQLLGGQAAFDAARNEPAQFQFTENSSPSPRMASAKSFPPFTFLPVEIIGKVLRDS